MRPNERLQPKIADDRRCVRKPVRLSTSIVTATGIVTAQVSDVSERGCRLRLAKALACYQYVALEVYQEGLAAALHVPLAQVQWTKGPMAGVKFLSLNENTQLCLSQLIRD